MAENKMKEVAELLGLELGQEFKIKDCSGDYKLTRKGLVVLYYDNQPDWLYSSLLEYLLAGELEIIKLPIKPTLTNEEKAYLSNIIKPKSIRNRVINIKKCCFEKYEYICINTDERFDYDDGYTLPFFEKGTMYKGMEVDKGYTLEELGL